MPYPSHLLNIFSHIQLIIIPTVPDIRHTEQAINNILMLKTFVQSVPPLFEALSGARSELLVMIQQNCRAENIDPTIQFICEVINDDVVYQKTPLDLRNQRTYAVKVCPPPTASKIYLLLRSPA